MRLMPEDFVQVGKMLADAGIDAIEVSGGLPISPKTKAQPVRHQ